ncbi:glycosyl transferase family 1 [Bacteroidales bacterium]|nr:glycosyl transferase family 1 [Bacteroidales bacterium]
MAKTLVVRYSQIGDVLISIPLIYSLAKQNPGDNFTVLTNPKFVGLFAQMPCNVVLMPMIYRKKKIPLRGLLYLMQRYFLVLKLLLFSDFDKVVLLQNGSFEDQLKWIYELKKSKVSMINLKSFLSPQKLQKPFVASTESLLDIFISTFAHVGYCNLTKEFDISYYKNTENKLALLSKNEIDAKRILVGIAPFSRLEAKVFPLDEMEKVIDYFKDYPNVQVLIFGGGENEKRIAENWKAKFPSIIPLIGKLSFDEELIVIAACKLMVSMDSANLHLASLLKIPAVSIWGPSHPDLGYYPYNEKKENAILLNLSCSPCSFWGENACTNKRKYACMDISPKIVIYKIESLLK